MESHTQEVKDNLGLTAKERKRIKNLEYYYAHRDKWIQYEKKRFPDPHQSVIFTATHTATGKQFVGVTRSLKQYLRSPFVKQSLGGNVNEWNIQVFETLPDHISMRDMRARARNVAIELCAQFLSPKDLRDQEISPKVRA